MSDIIRRFMNRFFPHHSPYTITIFGPPGTGKTTLLYHLQRGEVVTTWPTTGINIETVEAPTSSGQRLKFTGWDFGLGCAGAWTMVRLYSTYASNGHAVIWVIDADEGSNLEESVPGLNYLLDKIDDALGTAERRKRFPILILGNKRGKSKAMPIDSIRRAFAKLLSGRTAHIAVTSFIQPLNEGGLPDAFGWLQFALENGPDPKSNPAPESTTALDKPGTTTNPTDKLESWLTRAETDISPQEFIAQFNSFSLPAWDHYTHIRIAYILLTTHGRKEGKDMIFDGIEKYIAQSSQARGRAFHLTMTYFWIQIVHLGIQSVSLSTSEKISDSTSVSESPLDPFTRFILLNPYVSDANLWTDYYSMEVMMSPGAKSALVLPDKKPLPNLVVRDAIAT